MTVGHSSGVHIEYILDNFFFIKVVHLLTVTFQFLSRGVAACIITEECILGSMLLAGKRSTK